MFDNSIGGFSGILRPRWNRGAEAIRPPPRSLFGTCVGDSIADRTREVLLASPNGLTPKQIGNLFHGHVSSGSIDQALERLSSLKVVTSRYATGRSRLSTLRLAIDLEDAELMEEETAESEELAELVRLVRTF